MYFKGYNFDDDNVRIDIPVGLCNTYDIPESGSVTDSHGRHITIRSHTDYGQYIYTNFKLDQGVKFDGIADAVSTLQEFIPSLGINLAGDAEAIYNDLGAPSRITPDQQDTSGTIQKPYIQFQSNQTYWYPPSGTSTNFTYRPHNVYALPCGSYFMAYYTGDESDQYGGYYYGIFDIFTFNQQTGYTEINIVRCINFNANTWGKPERSPGDKGFRPIGDHPVDKVIGGGTISGHTPKYQTDNISQPGAPDESSASASRLGFLRVYKVDEANLNKIGQLLFNPVFLVMLAGFVDPMDAIISLNIFPCSPDVGGAQTIGALGYNLASQVLGLTAQGYPISTQFKTLDFGTVVVPEDWESYLDYDATSVTLFLPFIGEVELPSDEVVGSSVNVQYTIDFFTGMCVANVLIVKSVILSSRRTVSHKTQHSYQGNCAINLPLSAVNYGSMIGSFINASSNGLRTGMAGAVGSFASDVVSGNFKPTITTKGTLSANAGYCGILYPYIIVTRPITTEPDKYQEVLGYPSYMENSIGACKGLCVCEDIKLNSITGATDSELSQIKQLCREGVYN